MNGADENFPKKREGEDVTPKEVVQMPVQSIKPQSRESFIEQAVEDYEAALIGYARTILHDLERSRDVVQDTYIRLCQQDVEKVRDNLKTWLFTVCRNRAFDVLRKDKRVEPLDEIRFQRVAGNDMQPDERMAGEERLAKVLACMDRLGKNQKEVILLKFQQGMSYQEIQEVTGLTQGNIGFLIHTGLKRLREILPDDT